MTLKNFFYNNTIYDNKFDIANILNQYFVNVGPTPANNLPSVAIDFKSFLGPSIQNSIFVDQITTTEVCNVIHSMAGGTAAGDDGFNLELVKSNAPMFAPPLTYIYDLSLSTGIVPIRFKIAKVIPIFKRMIKKLLVITDQSSLLRRPIFNKILEKLTSKRLYNFLDHENF